jgi:hypothetical protein
MATRWPTFVTLYLPTSAELAGLNQQSQNSWRKDAWAGWKLEPFEPVANVSAFELHQHPQRQEPTRVPHTVPAYGPAS